MTDRFPQVLSIKTGDMKARVQALQDGMNKLTGYFNELIVEFGESKEDYTVDSFFKVLVDFYDIFMNELATLEKKKKDAEELRKRMANQEMITKSIRAHAMDTFQGASEPDQEADHAGEPYSPVHGTRDESGRVDAAVVRSGQTVARLGKRPRHAA